MSVRPMRTNPSSAPLLDDQPSTNDLLHFEQFVSALEAIIMNPQTKTPFIIGVFGRWGTGKTTLMRMLETRLTKHSITTVWFSAWLYNSEDHIWAAFLQSLTNRLASALPLRDKLSFSAGVYRRGWAWSRLLYEAPKFLVKVGLILAPAFFGAVFATRAASALAARLFESGGVVATTMLAVFSFLRPVWSSLKQNAKPDFSLYRSMDFEAHVSFLDQFREQFARIVASLPGNNRLLVFVDDLDRCGADKTLQLLDAIKVFLDVPNCIFVLGVDVAVIQRAIAHKYPDDGVAQKEYLSKIVQLPFHLPPLTERDLQEYLMRLAVFFPDERCRAVFLQSLSRNPREIKRVINTFSLHWYLALARSLQQNDDVTPVRLAKVIVVQQAYPTLFSLLRDQPELLALIEQQFRRKLGQSVSTPPPVSKFDASQFTQEIAPSGLSFPPSLAPYTEELSLIRLLTMHALEPEAEDKANFASLSGEAIQVYFTLTRSTSVLRAQPADSGLTTPLPVAAHAPDASEEAFPDFGDRYTVLGRIGQGGTSEVYRARDRTTENIVAIKRLLPTLANQPSWRHRFEREMNFLSRLHHPNLVQILEVGSRVDAQGHPILFFSMELEEGSPLNKLLQERGKLSPEEAVPLLGPLFDALGYMHETGIIHRDVKPSTILIGSNGVAKLADLGIALERSEGRDTLTRTGYVLGTPGYMSPEQFRDDDVDGRSDLFSLGVVIFESLTGNHPFGAGSDGLLLRMMKEDPTRPSSLAAELPKSFDRFIARILAKKPDDRFATAAHAKTSFYAAFLSEPSGVGNRPET